jgi:outer membrane protein, heavy metal efflux system
MWSQPTCAAVFCAFLPAITFAQDFTERRALELFWQQQPLQREARAQVAIAEAESRGRTLLANPTISVAHEGAGRTEFYQAGQTIPVSGRLPLLKAAGVQQSQAAASEGEAMLWRAQSSLRAAFYRLVASQERYQSYADSEKDLALTIRILRDREREGEGSRLDRLRAERERLDWRAEAAAIQSLGALEKGDLQSFLPPAVRIDFCTGSLDTLFREPTLDALIATAQSKRAELAAERQRLAQFDLERRAAERLRIPEPTVFAGLKRAAQNSAGPAGGAPLSNGAVAGLSLSLPIFNQGQAEAAKWSAERQRAEARLEALSRRVNAAIEAAWQSFLLRRAARDEYSRSLEENEELTRVSRIAYQEGEIGILQLLDAFRLRRSARLRMIDLSLAAKEAQIHLESLIGEELPQ